MYETLEDIEIQFEYEKLRAPKFSLKTCFKEIKVLLIIFISIFLGMYLITNAQLIIDHFYDHFSPTKVPSFSIETISSTAHVFKDTQQKAEAVEELIQTYSGIIPLEKELAPTIDQLLRSNLERYDFDFNVLPPTNRLVISAINLDVPLVQTKIKDYEEFSAGSFDKELENWVVKYPTTPNPGEWGNVFLFGHTSQEYRKKNKYGTVFRNIPQLKAGDRIQVVREGKLYEYQVVQTEIVSPKQVNATYLKYADLKKEYLTLMGCYPIGRTDKRMMVFAERVN